MEHRQTYRDLKSYLFGVEHMVSAQLDGLGVESREVRLGEREFRHSDCRGDFNFLVRCNVRFFFSGRGEEVILAFPNRADVKPNKTNRHLRQKVLTAMRFIFCPHSPPAAEEKNKKKFEFSTKIRPEPPNSFSIQRYRSQWVWVVV